MWEYNELYHWGIKGQKWGVRRYQNEDGSLTPEGRKRYGNLQSQEEIDAAIKADKGFIKAERSMARMYKGEDTRKERRAERLRKKFEDNPTERNRKRSEKASARKEEFDDKFNFLKDRLSNMSYSEVKAQAKNARSNIAVDSIISAAATIGINMIPGMVGAFAVTPNKTSVYYDGKAGETDYAQERLRRLNNDNK